VASLPHITVCICTFKRSALLRDLLAHLESQRTEGLFTLDVVVVDNDSNRSAEQTVQTFAARSPLRVTYSVEPEQNISLARNRAVRQASGDLLAFIDDDEVPVSDWLAQLVRTHSRYSVDGVLGPVVTRFQVVPPLWVTRGRFFDRFRHPTGVPVAWPEARTGNVLVARDSLRDLDPPFRPQFGSGGEDVDFFRRLIVSGRRFVWCDEAVVHELVPPSRCTRRFLIGRAVLRGSNFPKQSGARVKNILKSVVAVPCYALALPVLAVMGQHYFVSYLVKLSDHGSRLLAVAGVRLATQREN
jgi:glycosyltransferase involved in cell wall biosynthesis